MNKKVDKKTDEEILFPEAKVGEYTIKPWSFGVLFEISDMLEGILDKLEDKKIKIEDIVSADGFISYTNIFRLFTIASKDVLSIIAITLDISEEEIKGMDMEEGIKIAIVIYKQNSKMFVKNFLTPLTQEGKK